MKLVVFVFALATFASLGLVQNTGRKIIDAPKVQPPAEALASGLGGGVNVEVKVNDAGSVTSVENTYGPDWVCPTIKDPDVLALRNAAAQISREIKFEPGKESTTEWVQIKFPVKKIETEKETGSADPSSGIGPTVTRKRPSSKTISAGIVNGKAISLAKPLYPAAARTERASGAVTIEVLIDEEGRVYSAQPVNGHPLLLGAARLAACESRFSPTRLNGETVKVRGGITYNFVP